MLLLLLVSFLFITLLSLKSFNGYLFFVSMSFTAFAMLIVHAKRRTIKWFFFGCLILLTILPIFYVSHCVQKFYDVKEYSIDDIAKYTAAGRAIRGVGCDTQAPVGHAAD
jgi:hypothetical protein